MDNIDSEIMSDDLQAEQKTKINLSFYKGFKRIFDLFLSTLSLIGLLPVLLIVSLSIALFGGKGKIFYAHERIGLHGKPFRMYKFRSMREGVSLADVASPKELESYYKEYKLQNDPRVTKIGGFLRKTSLDELPQLINILKGDMSFIGPRPVTYEETLFYGENRDTLLSVKPGLTGYWQAYARNAVSYANGKRQEMELYYVENQSLRLDIIIFFKTFGTVLSKKNSY